MESNTLYYFYSTVAQSLAGLVGLLGAFTVLRLADLEHRLGRALDECHGQIAGKDAFHALRAAGKIVELISKVDQELQTTVESAKSAISRPLEEIKAAHQSRQALYSAAKCALATTGASIALALVGILTTEVVRSGGGPWMMGGVILQLIALGVTARSYWHLATRTIGGAA